MAKTSFKTSRIGFIGCGAMAKALAGGLVEAGLPAAQIRASDPVAAARESFAKVKKIYDVFGAGDRIEQEVFSGDHRFHGVRGLPFSAKFLKA